MDDDRIKRLEKICDELKARDDDESSRQRTADSKLTSALAVIPIIIALSTSSFVALLALCARLGWLGQALAFAFLIAIIFFVLAAFAAIYGLWPMRARYAAIGLRTLSTFAEEGTYEGLLCTIIKERQELVRVNSQINGRKLGDYADAAQLTVIGLIPLTVMAVALVLAFVYDPHKFAGDGATTEQATSNTSAHAATQRATSWKPQGQHKH